MDNIPEYRCVALVGCITDIETLKCKLLITSDYINYIITDAKRLKGQIAYDTANKIIGKITNMQLKHNQLYCSECPELRMFPRYTALQYKKSFAVTYYDNIYKAKQKIQAKTAVNNYLIIQMPQLGQTGVVFSPIECALIAKDKQEIARLVADNKVANATVNLNRIIFYNEKLIDRPLYLVWDTAVSFKCSLEIPIDKITVIDTKEYYDLYTDKELANQAIAKAYNKYITDYKDIQDMIPYMGDYLQVTRSVYTVSLRFSDSYNVSYTEKSNKICITFNIRFAYSYVQDINMHIISKKLAYKALISKFKAANLGSIVVTDITYEIAKPLIGNKVTGNTIMKGGF